MNIPPHRRALILLAHPIDGLPGLIALYRFTFEELIVGAIATASKFSRFLR